MQTTYLWITQAFLLMRRCTARDVFQAKKVVIVTQKYHLYRAVYVARALGLDAYGVASDPRPYSSAVYNNARKFWRALRLSLLQSSSRSRRIWAKRSRSTAAVRRRTIRLDRNLFWIGKKTAANATICICGGQLIDKVCEKKERTKKHGF